MVVDWPGVIVVDPLAAAIGVALTTWFQAAEAAHAPPVTVTE